METFPLDALIRQAVMVPTRLEGMETGSSSLPRAWCGGFRPDLRGWKLAFNLTLIAKLTVPTRLEGMETRLQPYSDSQTYGSDPT